MGNTNYVSNKNKIMGWGKPTINDGILQLGVRNKEADLLIHSQNRS